MGLGEASVYPIAAAGREAPGVPGPVLELRLPSWDPGRMGGRGRRMQHYQSEWEAASEPERPVWDNSSLAVGGLRNIRFPCHCGPK